MKKEKKKKIHYTESDKTTSQGELQVPFNALKNNNKRTHTHTQTHLVATAACCSAVSCAHFRRDSNCTPPPGGPRHTQNHPRTQSSYSRSPPRWLRRRPRCPRRRQRWRPRGPPVAPSSSARCSGPAGASRVPHGAPAHRGPAPAPVAPAPGPAQALARSSCCWSGAERRRTGGRRGCCAWGGRGCRCVRSSARRCSPTIGVKGKAEFQFNVA